MESVLAVYESYFVLPQWDSFSTGVLTIHHAGFNNAVIVEGGRVLVSFRDW